MKTAGAISTTTSILVLALSCFSNAYAQTSQNQKPVETEQKALVSAQRAVAGPETSQESKKSRTRMNFVKMMDFYLRNGKLVFGKLLSEDKNKVTVEELDESKIVVSTYSKREIDPRTLHTRNVPEFKYYLDLAEYFSGRTWDFRDDPDDFIQAIRCYEKAKRSAAETQAPASNKQGEKIEQINQKIENLQADRQIWIREVTSRAELKKLEFAAVMETRVKELENKVKSNSQQVNKSVEQLGKIIADTKDSHQKLEKTISKMNKNMSRQLETLEGRIEANRRLIDSIGRYWRWYPERPKPY